jgi:altronate hydrolase
MPMNSLKNRLSEVAILMDPEKDQVAVAKQALKPGQAIIFNNTAIKIKDPVARGHRFAIKDIPNREFVRQFGYAFGRSKGIKSGEPVTTHNIENIVPDVSIKEFKEPPLTCYKRKFLEKTFSGFRRRDGKVGTRNYYLIVPTSMCASETCVQIANQMSAKKKWGKGLDGIVAIPHSEGCGCDSGISIDRLLRILKGYISHPNVGGCLVIDLGCEQTDYSVVSRYMKDVVEESWKPIDWLTIEASGGVEATKAKARKIIGNRLVTISQAQREPVPIESLILGTECGASDSFSGITANPLIGNVADKVIFGKGSAILSEIPEMVGTFPMLFSRFRSQGIAAKFLEALKWYEDLAFKMGADLADNLVPKNIEGGLMNPYIKSLGAVLKGGTTVIEDVVDYGERLRKPGLSIMQGPGGDLESVTGLVSSGANIICFSTGQGTPTGNAICPIIKVTSNNEVFNKLARDVDFNAGRLLTERESINSLGDELLEMLIKVASGQMTAAEKLNQRQFQIWTAGKLPL